MVRLLYRQLTLRPLRTVLTASALAAVVAVVLVLEGFNEGLVAQLGDAVRSRQADLIVTQAGVSNMIAARSVVPQFARREVEAIEGVAVAHPLTGIPLIYAEGERRTPIFLFVYEAGGGPLSLEAGHRPSAAREIVIDRSIASKYDLLPGEKFVISGFEFRISGISKDSAAFFTPFAFARYDDLIDFYFESDVAADISTFPLLSFLLVRLSDEADVGSVAASVERRLPEVDVYLPEELAARDEQLGRALFGPIMRLMISVGYIIGALVMGIVLFASVDARRREFGVLKALGFGQRYLNGLVLSEATVLALVAVPAGTALAVLIGQAIESLFPLYRILVLEPSALTRTAIACVAFAAAGALIPVRLIRRLDPAMVFRG